VTTDFNGPPGLTVGGSPAPNAATLTAAEVAMIREGLGYTRADMAKHLGVSVQTIGHWESGKYAVPKGVGVELEDLEGEWLDLVNRLARHLLDAGQSTLTIPREATADRPAGWWRSIAHQVTLQVPGLDVTYSDAARA